MVEVNIVAILLSVIWAMFVGSMWYGPLFGKPWMKMMGLGKEKITGMASTEMAKLYGIQFMASVIMAYVLRHSLEFGAAFQNTQGISAGLSAGFWNWLGFVMPVTLSKVLWEGKPWKLWFIDNGNFLVTLLGMGVILSLL
jgi:hypothetical protein